MTPARRRLLSATGLAVVALGGAAVIGAARDADGSVALAARTPEPTHTATVERHDLVNRERVDGTLGYAPMHRQVTSGRMGTLTSIAAEGAVVDRGGALFAVDGRPVVLLFGDQPMYRPLAEGARGDDVRQLEENLVALGKATWAQVGRNDGFTAGTTAAVKRLQKALGVEESGRVEPGDVVFLPAKARIAAHRAVLGGRVADGTEIVEVSSTERVVTVQLAASKQGRVRAGDSVTVELPGGATTPGRVAAIARTAKSEVTSGGSTRTTVEVLITLDDPAASGDMDRAPVKVGITTARAEGVLTVPVTALVATAEGGYAVEVVRQGGGRELVAVEAGMFSDSADLVEVTGDVQPGDVVVTAG